MHGTCTYNEIAHNRGRQAAPFPRRSYPEAALRTVAPIFLSGSAHVLHLLQRVSPVCGHFSWIFGRSEVASIDDEYTFGPAFSRDSIYRSRSNGAVQFYLPRAVSGATTGRNEMLHGGQIHSHNVPIDTIPFFVRGRCCSSAWQADRECWPEARPPGDLHLSGGRWGFWLFNDDGRTCAHEKGDTRITTCIEPMSLRGLLTKEWSCG